MAASRRGKILITAYTRFQVCIFLGAILSRTSELMKLPGTVAAGLFSRKVSWNEFEGTLTPAKPRNGRPVRGTITLTMEMHGRLLGRLADQSGWDDCYGWVTWGPEMSIVAIHDSLSSCRREGLIQSAGQGHDGVGGH